MAEHAALWMSKELAEQIRSHGASAYPHECCGALIGREAAGSEARQVLRLFPLVNRRDDSPRNRFSVSAEDVRDAEKASLKQGLEVVGWYHSHPDHPATPSEFDREHAWPWYSYIIVSVQQGAPAEMTSWRLTDDRRDYLPEPIEIRQTAVV